MTDCLTHWLTERQINWLTSRLIAIQTKSCLSIWQLTNRLVERLIVSLTDNEIDGNQINWLPAYMIDRLTGWHTVHCSTGFSVCPSVPPFVWPSYQLIIWLSDKPNNWPTVCLTVCQFNTIGILYEKSLCQQSLIDTYADWLISTFNNSHPINLKYMMK